MTETTIKGTNGYEIPCVYTLTGAEKKAVLVIHGFGSSKESPTAQMLTEHFPKQGIGTLALDLPAHGESPVGGECLTLANCLADMKAAEQEIKRLAPEAELLYFGSSFGAYLTLLLLASGKAGGKKAFLRSSAVEMPKILRERAFEHRGLLEKQGYLMADEDYVRPLKLMGEFFDELEANDVFETYKAGCAEGTELYMVHGSLDETASFEAAKAFAGLAGARFTALEGGDHRLSLAGMPERVTELAAGFFLEHLPEALPIRGVAQHIGKW
ncbi:MAG: alpha/beta hydrolase [Firmicutes bacterium]|nr:alpha/beta hydrolase [Bacillota bacterium]